MSWEGNRDDVAPMGSKGSTRAKLDSARTRVREKTLEVSASPEPASSDEEGSATLGCASAYACVGVGVGVASYAITLMTFQSIRPWTASRKVRQLSIECPVS